MRFPHFKLFLSATLLTLAVPAHAADRASVPAPQLSEGDSWILDQTHERGQNGFSKQRIDLKIERVSPDNMVVGAKPDGAPTDFVDHIGGLDWSQRRILNDKETTTARPLSFPLKVGKTWVVDFNDPRTRGLITSTHVHSTYKVVGWQDVTVPAGKFRAIEIEMNGTLEAKMAATSSITGGAAVAAGESGAAMRTTSLGPRTVSALTYSEIYYVPSIKYFVKTLDEQYNSDNVRIRRDSQELISFKLNP